MGVGVAMSTTRQTMALSPSQLVFEHHFLIEKAPTTIRDEMAPVEFVTAICKTLRPAPRCSCAFYDLEWAPTESPAVYLEE